MVIEPLIKALLTAWLAAAALWDARWAIIPNWLTLPLMLAVGVLRLYQRQWIVLPIWVLVYLLWRVNIIGGGDAKLLMGIFALFPTFDFAFVFAVLVAAVTLPLLVLQHWGRRPADLVRGVAHRLHEGPLMPTREELETEGRQYAWTFCLPGVVYLWLWW